MVSTADTYLNGLGSFLVLWVNDSARMFQATTTANFKHFLPQLKETLQKFPMAAETKERLNVFQSVCCSNSIIIIIIFLIDVSTRESTRP